MRPIDADELKNTIDKIKIVIDEGILECNTIHETLVYLLGKVEAAVNEAIDEQPTIEAGNNRAAMERIVDRLETALSMHKISLTFRPEWSQGFRAGLEKAIRIVKEELGKETP